MKIVEVTRGLLLPVTNEETDLLSKFHEGNSVSRKDLDEREIVIANNLVTKDVLARINNDGRVTYTKKIS
jgi:hypothetical protein